MKTRIIKYDQDCPIESCSGKLTRTDKTPYIYKPMDNVQPGEIDSFLNQRPDDDPGPPAYDGNSIVEVACDTCHQCFSYSILSMDAKILYDSTREDFQKRFHAWRQRA